MESKPNQPLIVIVGQTASGKSSLALELARKYNGEIICADSRTIYQGMDIGSAKPTVGERQTIRHHLLDVVKPNQSFTAADFKELAIRAINDIQKRGKIPFLVGGTGLYVDSVIFDYQFGPVDQQLRQELELMSLSDLQKKADSARISPEDIDFSNKRHLVRAIERGGAAKSPNQLRPNTLVIGLEINKDQLSGRVQRRIENMLKNNLLKEVESLAKEYGWGSEALSAIGYKEWQPYFDGEQTLDQAKEVLYNHTMQYAKRQKTWFARNEYIKWVNKSTQAHQLAAEFIQKFATINT